MKTENYKLLAISIGVCLLTGFIGGFFTAPAIGTWYASLNKPAINPPNWIFFPVWTILYILMGASLYLVLKNGWKSEKIRAAAEVFGAQLFLNFLWSAIFFGLRSPAGALAEIIFLWLAILLTILKFYKISKPAAYLLIPYIFWVSFAAYLNYSVWILN